MHISPAEGLFELELPYPDSVSELFSRFRHLKLPVLLSSGDNGELGARYDIITAAPDKILSTRQGETVVECADGVIYSSGANPVDVLQEHFPNPQLQQIVPERFPFAGGVIGFLSYDMLHQDLGIIADQQDDIQMPLMLAGVYHWAIVVDHEANSCHLLTLASCGQNYRSMIFNCLENNKGRKPQSFQLTSGFDSNFSKAEYTAAFRKIIDYIHAGDCYQVNLAQRFSADYSGDAFAAFCHLNDLANAPFSAFLEYGADSVLSFSPERFLRVRNGKVITQPIKGTRPRSKDPEQDRMLLENLVSSKKDRAENLMIVDLLRNDLGRVCETGSVHVPGLFEAQSFRNVHHLVSTVGGELQRPTDVFALLKACFPGGSITGTPKIRAMQIINELETRPRSVYCGSIFYIGVDGSMDSNICIRTLVCARNRIHCWGGGGIVADSRAEQEYQETLDKISLFISNLH